MGFERWRKGTATFACQLPDILCREDGGHGRSPLQDLLGQLPGVGLLIGAHLCFGVGNFLPRTGNRLLREQADYAEITTMF